MDEIKKEALSEEQLEDVNGGDSSSSNNNLCIGCKYSSCFFLCDCCPKKALAKQKLTNSPYVMARCSRCGFTYVLPESEIMDAVYQHMGQNHHPQFGYHRIGTPI